MSKAAQTSKAAIIMKGDYDYNMRKVLQRVIEVLQNKYDVDSVLIEQWLNSDEFHEFLDQQNKECYGKIMSADHKLLNQLLDIAHTDIFVDEYMPWEKEKCGHIMEEFSNGYVQYCNQHRYLHQTKEKTNDVDHFFVAKTANEVIEEKIFSLNFNLYLDYTRLLASVIQIEFEKMILNKGYHVYLVKNDQFELLHKWMKKHNKDFREKKPTYQEDQVYVKAYLNLTARQKLTFEAIKVKCN